MSLKESGSGTTCDDSPECENTSTEGSAGLEPTRQVPASEIECIGIGSKTVTELWQTLLIRDGVQEAFVRAAREFCRGRTLSGLYDALDEQDIPYQLHGGIESVGRGHRAREFLSSARYEVGTNSPLSTLFNTARLCEQLESAPILPIRINREEFKTLRREQREAVCELLAVLSKGFDVRLICGRLTRAWLRENHRESLPGVSEWCNTHHKESSVGAALEALDPDGREATILRLLDDEPADTLSYHALHSKFDVSRSRVRQCLSTLSEYGLIETFGVDRKASLLEAGREFLSSITTQTTLEKPDSPTPKTHLHNRVNPAAEDSPPQRECYRTKWMDRPQHTAAVACSTGNSGITAVKDNISHHSSKDRLVSFNEQRREAVVSIAGGSVQEYTVSSATALTTPKFLDAVLPTSELARIVEDEPDTILRDARCIGWLSEEAIKDAETLRDRLVEQGIVLADLTKELRHGERDDPENLCSEIVRLAQGLAGTVVHLLDHADVTLIREVRVPAGLSLDQLEDLAESITTSALIQSRYGAFAAYRQLIESRDEKRRTALSPEVDSTDPVGSLVGEFVIRGSDCERLKTTIEGQLSGSKPHDEAPEFAINIPVESVNRSGYAVVAHRILKRKNIKATREAVTILHGLADSPYLAGYALNQLDGEEAPREIRADELRYALNQLDGEHILSELPRSVGKIVAALLEATEPLTQTELSECAGVSTQTIRNNRAALEAIDIVLVDGTEWRVALSFSTKAERRSGIVPALVSKEALFRDVLSEFLSEILPPKRYGDPDDPVAGAVFYPPEPWVLLDHDQLAGWVKLIARLTEMEIPEMEQSSTVSVGPQLEQQSIQQTSSAIAG